MNEYEFTGGGARKQGVALYIKVQATNLPSAIEKVNTALKATTHGAEVTIPSLNGDDTLQFIIASGDAAVLEEDLVSVNPV